MDEPEFRAHWADERAVVAAWLPDAEPEPGLLPSPDPGVRLARELRLLLRSVAERRPPRSAGLAGGLATSCCPAGCRPPGRPCCRPSTRPDPASWERLALRLAAPAGPARGARSRRGRPAGGDHPVRRRGGAVLALPGRAGTAGGPAADDRPGAVAGGDLRRPGQRLRAARRPLGQLPARRRGRLRVRAGRAGRGGRAVPAPGGRGGARTARAGAGGLGHRLRAGASAPARRASPRRPRRRRCAGGRSGWARPARPGCSRRRPRRRAGLGDGHQHPADLSGRVPAHRRRAAGGLDRPAAAGPRAADAAGDGARPDGPSGAAGRRPVARRDAWPPASAACRWRRPACASVWRPPDFPRTSVRREADAYALRLPGCVDQLRDFERLSRQAARRRGDRADAGGPALPAGRAGPLRRRPAARGRAGRVGGGRARPAARPRPPGWAPRPRGWRTSSRSSRRPDAARRSLDLDPFHDPSWALLAEVHERLGDHSAAAVTRREHARVSR